jgi:hypothetical protein
VISKTTIRSGVSASATATPSPHTRGTESVMTTDALDRPRHGRAGDIRHADAKGEGGVECWECMGDPVRYRHSVVQHGDIAWSIAPNAARSAIADARSGEPDRVRRFPDSDAGPSVRVRAAVARAVYYHIDYKGLFPPFSAQQQERFHAFVRRFSPRPPPCCDRRLLRQASSPPATDTPPAARMATAVTFREAVEAAAKPTFRTT